MDNGNSAAHQVREAAERIRQEQQAWQGVGLMAVENLDTGACSALLVPSDAPCPNWLRDGKGLGWDRHEDMDLLTRLPRWYRSLSAQPDGRWSEWQNMLRIRCPDALVAQLPAPTRLLQVRHGFGAYLVPMSATTPTLLGRLLAWLLPWERLPVTFTAGDGSDLPGAACTTWACQEGVVPSWPPSSGQGGAGGRTWEERVTSGGTREWGVVVAWPRAVDAVVAFLAAQADAMDAGAGGGAVAAATAPARQGRWTRLSKDRRHVVLVAVHEASTAGKVNPTRPKSARQASAFRWALEQQGRDVRAVLAAVRADWLPVWFMDRLREEYPAAITVPDLLDGVRDEEAFMRSVRKGMMDSQRTNKPGGVRIPKMEHGGT